MPQERELVAVNLQGVKELELRPLSVEMIAKNVVHEVRLSNSTPICFALDELLVIVGDDELLVFCGERPGAYVAVQRTSTANAAFDVVTLLTERLEIAQIVRALPGSRNLVVWAELYIRFLLAARSASVAVSFPKCFPISFAQLCPRLAFLAYVQALQLVAGSFLYDGSETFLSLQFPHMPENVLIRLLASGSAESVDGSANLGFGKHGTWDAVPCGPECLQDHRVVVLICRAGRHKTILRFSEPLLPTSLRLVRSASGSEEKTLAGARFSHFTLRLERCA